MAKGYFGIDFVLTEYLDDDELDTLRALMAYMLMDNTEMDRDMIYSLVFQSGRTIIWH